MKFDAAFFSSPTGQLSLAGAVILFAGGALFWQHTHGHGASVTVSKPPVLLALPRTFTREGTRVPAKTSTPSVVMTEAPATHVDARRTPATKTASMVQVLPITLYVHDSEPAPVAAIAPFGRLIPCETVVALESNRLDTPVIGLVTEEVWEDGKLVIPKNTEVHGRAALDRSRERIAVSGAWKLVWRTPGADNGLELTVQGLALDREIDPATGRWGEHDGSAGLRGTVLRTDEDRELKLFAATFLSTATTALEDTRTATGVLGEVALPAITARNASLAGTSAVLREYAQQIREAIARDGFYLRVAAGTRFYLYVTQTLDRSQAKRTAAPSSS